jgi:hypothetical protein
MPARLILSFCLFLMVTTIARAKIGSSAAEPGARFAKDMNSPPQN